MTGSEYIIQFLISKQIKTVFGYPGASILAIYDAIYQNNCDNICKINHIMARHEQGAVNMALGYARASGRPGVCIATSGPGATNLTTGIADAYLDSIPLLILTGQVPVGFIGRDAFQEADIMGMTIPITKHNYLVKNAVILPQILDEAWRICTSGRPGPVLVDISSDVLDAEISEKKSSEETDKYGILPRNRKNEYPISKQINAIVEEIGHSYRPVIIAGGGVIASEAGDALSKFAADYKIPVAVTLMGMGLVLDKNVNMLGLTGKFGTPAANAAVEQCDTVIAIGTRFSDRTIGEFDRFSRSHFIIHCDIDQAELSKNVKADIAIACDAREFLDELLKHNIEFDKKAVGIWNAQLKSVKAESAFYDDETTPKNSCETILDKIDGFEKDLQDAIYVTDVGNHQMAAARLLEPIYERGFITSGGLGAMGFGLPGTVGAAIAISEINACNVNNYNSKLYASEMNKYAKQIVLICGDGGFQMTEEELIEVKKAPLPIKIFIMDDGALGMIKSCQQQKYGGRIIDSKLDNPDFCLIGKAYGLKTAEIKPNDESLETKISEILRSDEPVLVHCDVR